MLDAHDWDKHSSSSLSEVSVACLQDRIMQMEETHYRFVDHLQVVTNKNREKIYSSRNYQIKVKIY